MPNVQLARYFKSRGRFGDVDFERLEETQPQGLFTAWLSLDDADRHAMDAEFREIFELSCEKGFRAILDEAEWHLANNPENRAALVEKLANMSNHFERAMVTDNTGCQGGQPGLKYD